MPSSRLPELIARRGNVAEYPENTLPALRSALELGARHLGFDVQLSVDRQPVLLNDSNLQRIAGVDRNALEMTWDELAEIKITDTDIGVPRLGQAVDLLAGHATPTASVELKRRRAADARRAAHAPTTDFVGLKRATLRTFGQEARVRKVCEVLKPVAR